MLIRRLSRAFDPVYLKPTVLAGAIQQLSRTPIIPEVSPTVRRGQERRQQERRQRRQTVLLNLRSPHARRQILLRRQHEHPVMSHVDQIGLGIDLYA
ncbi:MAG: hypothetical protein HY080_13375 [Gammaproteobacteria bacterium]|nr:hypothetical protein [Gammaproteobacteria bacterium]